MTATTTDIKEQDGALLSRYAPPVQRAAYSDRMAWLLAIMSQLAYLRFEKIPYANIADLAKDLAAANDWRFIAEKLSDYAQAAGTPSDGQKILKKVLSACGFDLVHTFYNNGQIPLDDTEGFIAKSRAEKPFLVVAFRGTDSIKDWITNLQADLAPVGLNGVQIHAGFEKAYRIKHDEISTIINREDLKNLPLFMTGHSLGGALAMVATYHNKADRLAACYTYGAPRPGNYKYKESFHTPIYRIVNAHDPVPLIPPSGQGISVLKFIISFASAFINVSAVNGWLKKYQGYCHPGALTHMTAGEMDPETLRYPDVTYKNQFGFLDRLWRMAQLMISGELKRLDTYHDRDIYRRKLRGRMLDRLPPSVRRP